MNKPKILESTTLLDTFFSVQKDTLLYPNACIADYYVLRTTKESVAIIATNKDSILVMNEYRHPVQKILLGCPGGLVDPDENYAEAARRELLEETGCTADSFELLGWTYPLPGVLAQRMAVVLAHNARAVQDASHDDMELIDWQFLPIQVVKERIMSGHDVDAILCTALLFFLLNHKRS